MSSLYITKLSTLIYMILIKNVYYLVYPHQDRIIFIFAKEIASAKIKAPEHNKVKIAI